MKYLQLKIVGQEQVETIFGNLLQELIKDHQEQAQAHQLQQETTFIQKLLMDFQVI